MRVEGFVFAHVADEGLIESSAGDILRYRRAIGADGVLVFADIKKKHSAHAITADIDIVETAKAAEFFSVDGWLAPALVRPGGPELWVAGVSRATLRRATRTGVWHPVALPPGELREMAAELRASRPDSRVVLRIGVSLQPKPETGRDERGRHAIAGPAEWVHQSLLEYVEAGCNGFVVNLDYDSPGLEERVHEFGERVARPLRAAVSA